MFHTIRRYSYVRLAKASNAVLVYGNDGSSTRFDDNNGNRELLDIGRHSTIITTTGLEPRRRKTDRVRGFLRGISFGIWACIMEFG